MFGQSKPVVFNPYGRRRSGWRPPRWLVLLVSGVAVGAIGVVVVQERYLPPRLSAQASTELRTAFDEADSGRARLQKSLTETTQQLSAAMAEKRTLSDELAASRSAVARLRDDVAAVVATLPPDPRGGSVAVRAARFSAKGGTLSYEVVLTRERAGGKPLQSALQLLVTGEPAHGAATTVSLKPVPLSLGSHEVARGSAALPDGFRPRQATVQVLDRAGGHVLGMRVMLVK